MKKFLVSLLILAMLSCMFSVTSFAAPVDKNIYKYSKTIDYSTVAAEDLTGYNSVLLGSGNAASSETSIITDGGEKVLKWTTSRFTASGQRIKLAFPINSAFKAADGPFSLEFKAKLPINAYRWIAEGFMNLETDKTKATNTPALRFGLGQYRGTTFVPVANNSVYFVRQNEQKASDYFNKYTTYKFDIDPVNKTFRFYLKADGENSWTEPYANVNFSNPYTADTTDTFDKGLLPTGELPADDITAFSLSSGCYDNPGSTDLAAEVSYYISYISIKQNPKQNMAYSMDYSKMSTGNAEGVSVSAESGTASTNSASIVYDETLGKNVLAWTAGDTSAQNVKMHLNIPLGNMNIDTTKGPFSIVMNAKVPSEEVLATRSMIGCPNLMSGSTRVYCGLASYDTAGWGSGLACGNRENYTMSSQNIGGTSYLNNGYGEVTLANRKMSSLGSEIYGKYILYKFDVNPNTMSFRFFLSENGGATWIEPYKNFTFLKVSASSADDKMSAGELPLYNGTSKLPDIIDSLKFSIVEHGANGANAEANKAKVTDFRIASIDVVQGCSVVGSCDASVDTSNKVKVKFTNHYDNNEGLVVALYDWQDSLKSMIAAPAQNAVFDADYATGDYVKYFIFNSIEDIRPLTWSNKVDISAQSE